MRILVILATSDGRSGGMEKHATDLANGLAKRGHEIHFASLSAYHPRLDKGVRAVPIPAGASRFNPLLLFSLAPLVKNGGFDLVHAQGSKAAQITGMLKTLFPRQPCVATIHGFKSRYPRASAFCRIIAVSRGLAEHIGSDNVSVVYNGIDAPPGARELSEPVPPPPATPLWLAVGRLVPAKGFDILIEAFSTVPGTLWIAGEGPERARLEQLIQSSAQQDRIRLLGHRSDTGALMDLADAVVISSRREGFSYVFAEALLAEKPVVATDVPIANEFLDPRFICPTSNPHDLAGLMRGMTFEAGQQQEARQAAKTSLTLDAMTENTLAVYAACI
ncbi:glycosyltransferase [Marinobacter sp.]|uniref:glycosyltransferase n=1 Tax=Marinobacter sp. TaxID=50741 RepID=UPI00384E085E